jgi:hypothetical protein
MGGWLSLSATQLTWIKEVYEKKQYPWPAAVGRTPVYRSDVAFPGKRHRRMVAESADDPSWRSSRRPELSTSEETWQADEQAAASFLSKPVCRPSGFSSGARARNYRKFQR